MKSNRIIRQIYLAMNKINLIIMICYLEATKNTWKELN